MPRYTVGLNFHHHARIRKMYEQALDIERIAQHIPCTVELVRESLVRQGLVEEQELAAPAPKPKPKRRRKPSGDSSTVDSGAEQG